MRFLIAVGALILLLSCEDGKLHCPVYLETRLEMQEEPRFWTSPSREIWKRSGEKVTFESSRHITTKYKCIRNHDFEEICNIDDPNCIVKPVKEESR